MKYKILYADPAWKFSNKNTGGSMDSGAANKYPVMTLDAICKLPVTSIADNDAALFMWWVASMPEEALQVVKSWGFTLKTMTGFSWIKLTKKKLLPFFGMGFWSRQGLENCLIAVRGDIKRADASVRAVFSAPVEEHSKKPDLVRNRIVTLMGDLPRIELFAREQTPGWDVWGNEVTNSINLEVRRSA